MPRCAIYARFSTDMQRPTSAEDQVRVCQQRADREGWTVEAVYKDLAISGANIRRPGMTALLKDVAAERFDIILAEDLDRVARDQEDIAGIYKRIIFGGARLFTLPDGEVNEMHIGLKGTMNALELKKMAEKIRRGARGALSRGRIPGGLCYGYEPDPVLLEDGTVDRGRRRIVEDQAAVVRRVYTEFVAGRSPRSIAKGLNADGIPAPAGGVWRGTSLTGSAGRQLGILKNPIYVGRYVWNRVTMVKHPDSRNRLGRNNPVADRVETAFPYLRIVDDATWDEAHRIAADAIGVPLAYRQRPRHFLSRLVKCGLCGGNYTYIDRGRWGCNTRREAGTCTNGNRINGVELSSRVVAVLKDQLLSEEAVKHVLREYREEHAEKVREGSRRRIAVERQLASANAAIARLVDAISDGGASYAELGNKLAAKSAERDRAAEELEELAAPTVIALHPHLAEAYRARILELAERLNAGGAADEATVAAIRELIHAVTILPMVDGGCDITVLTKLHVAVELAQDGPSRRRSASRGALVVAEDRYHQPPPTTWRSFKA